MTMAAPSEADEAKVRRAVEGFAEAWNSHDLNSFTPLFAPDATFINVTGQWWRGRDEIVRNHAFVHGTIAKDAAPVTLPVHVYGVFKNSTHNFNRVEVRFLGPDTALAHGTWTLVGDARTVQERHGVMTLVLCRDGYRWRYAAVQNTEINRSVK